MDIKLAFVAYQLIFRLGVGLWSGCDSQRQAPRMLPAAV